MKYTVDEDKANDTKPTKIIANCTKGLKYRCMKACQNEGVKIDEWVIDALEQKLINSGGFTIN